MKIYINRLHKSFKNVKISHHSLIAVRNNRRNARKQFLKARVKLNINSRIFCARNNLMV